MGDQMKLVGAESVERKPRKPQPPKKVVYFTGSLACSRCPVEWAVVDLNPERKVVLCPKCGEPNDIREAIKRTV
jgi:anaerobic ribonucleoside-triphosphate reductase